MNIMDFKFKKVVNVIGIISGFTAIRYSAVVKKLSVGSYSRSEIYGGDAYTGIQNAAADAANNVNDLAIVMRNGISYLLLIAGLLAVCYFLSELLGDLSIQGLSEFIQNVSSGSSGTLPKMDGNNASAGAPNPAGAIAGAIKGRILSGNKASAPAPVAPAPAEPVAEPVAPKPQEAPAAEAVEAAEEAVAEEASKAAEEVVETGEAVATEAPEAEAPEATPEVSESPEQNAEA